MAAYGRRAASVVLFACCASGVLPSFLRKDLQIHLALQEVGELRVNGFIALSVLTYLTLLPFLGVERDQDNLIRVELRYESYTYEY